MYVYRFLNEDSEVIYVGRAKSLKSRISGHSHLPKECYDEIKRIEYIKLNNSSETNIYEIYFISRHSPKYNIVFNNEDIITFELPIKEWKEFKGEIKPKKNEDILEHKMKENHLYKINDIQYTISKEKIQEKRIMFEYINKNIFLFSNSIECCELLNTLFKKGKCYSISINDKTYTKYKNLHLTNDMNISLRNEYIDLFENEFILISFEEYFVRIIIDNSTEIIFYNDFKKIPNKTIKPIKYILDDYDLIFGSITNYVDDIYTYVKNNLEEFKDYIN